MHIQISWIITQCAMCKFNKTNDHTMNATKLISLLDGNGDNHYVDRHVVAVAATSGGAQAVAVVDSDFDFLGVPKLQLLPS